MSAPDIDLLDLYSGASEWTAAKIRGAADQLDAQTTCDDWDMRTLINHIVDTQNYFRDSALGKEASLPSPNPPEIIGNDPVGRFEQVRAENLDIYGKDGVIEKTGPALGIAFSDVLLHGWDIAKSSGQDTTMPDGLADVSYSSIHGKFTDDQRKGTFKPEVPVADDASAQDRLLAYTGRDPAG